MNFSKSHLFLLQLISKIKQRFRAQSWLSYGRRSIPKIGGGLSAENLNQHICVTSQGTDTLKTRPSAPPDSPEGVKKLEACAWARKDERLVETLGCGSSDVMGNLSFR